MNEEAVKFISEHCASDATPREAWHPADFVWPKADFVEPTACSPSFSGGTHGRSLCITIWELSSQMKVELIYTFLAEISQDSEHNLGYCHTQSAA